MHDVVLHARRPEGDWDPFMDSLFGEIRRIRRRRRALRGAAALLLAVGLGSLIQLARQEKPDLVRAQIPTADAPVFQPDGEAGASPLFYMVTVEGEES